jgi:hypothetical protein
MRFFTPELLARFRSNDERTAEKAADEWDGQSEAYASYWKRIRGQFPALFVRFQEDYYLHDAQIVSAYPLHDRLFVNLRLDTPPHDTLLLVYHLVALPLLSAGPSPPESPVNAPIYWLYDEAEVLVPQKTPLFSFFSRPHFRHSILLSSGQELSIDFRNFELSPVSNSQVLISGYWSIGYYTPAAPKPGFTPQTEFLRKRR